MRTAIALVLAIMSISASAQTAQEQHSTTCEWYLKSRPKLDVKGSAGLLGQDPEELEQLYIQLDRYCPEHPSEHLVSAMMRFLRQAKPR